MITSEILNVYKEIRQPYYSQYTGTGSHYEHQVDAESALDIARRRVKINKLWSEYEGERVRIRLEPDYSMSLDDLFGDSYNPVVNPEIQPHILERKKKAEIDRINRDGVWIMIGEYKCPFCGEWTIADSCGGFIGDDWKDSGYDEDIKQNVLEAAELWNLV